MKEIEFTAAEENVRLDRFLAGLESIHSRSFAEKLISSGSVSVNGSEKSKNYLVRTGDKIRVVFSETEDNALRPLDLSLKVLYEDDHLAVISKPAGIVTHPGAGASEGTLVSGFMFRFKQLSTAGGPRRPGVVHRLDKDTSGLMLVAKDNETHMKLAVMLKKREITKTYLALLEGRIPEESGFIDLPIARSQSDRKKMTVGKRAGREAQTDFLVLERFESYTLVKIRLITGRTHQIRVHFAFIGHPVAGDRIYGSKRSKLGLPRQFLHAAGLRFTHPISHRELSLEEPLPPELEKCLIGLRKNN